MGRSPCWSYVTWYNKLSSGDWATWEPGEIVSPGDVGAFNEDRRFRHWKTLRDYGVKFSVSRETPIGPRFYVSADGFRFETKVAGQSAVEFDLLGDLDAGVRITADRRHACILHLLDVTESGVVDTKLVLDQIFTLLRSGRWEVDSQVVMRRLRSRRGFAAVSQGAGQSVELRATANLGLPLEALKLGGADFVLASGHATTNFLLHEFGRRQTPVFDPPVRVRQSLWGRLLPWRTDGRWLIDPVGQRYLPSSLPTDLSNLAEEARRYDPERSAMTLAELSAMTVDDIFEEVNSLPDKDEIKESGPLAMGIVRPAIPAAPEGLAEIRSFPLPPPAESAALAAADPTDSARPLLDVTSPDDLTRFRLHDRGGGEYWLEVSLAPLARLPLVVAVRYGTVSGGEQDLLIPVDDDGSGQPSSVVDMDAYVLGASWRAWPAVPPDSVQRWPDDVVVASVRASTSMATVRAWERLISDVSPAIGFLISRELRRLRDMS